MAGEADVCVLLLVACIFPPAAVAFVAGCGADFCLNILLTILGYFPGLVHACWLVLRRSEANERYGYKNWTYSGMGEYAPVRPGSGQYPASYGTVPPQPPPSGQPPGQYPAGQAPPPSQAPVDQKSGGYAPPQAPPEQKYGGYGYQAPPSQAPVDQKAVNVSASAPADQKPADSTAPPPSGT